MIVLFVMSGYEYQLIVVSIMLNFYVEFIDVKINISWVVFI